MTEQCVVLDASAYSELVFNVGKLDINILYDSFVNVYDIPGLNDDDRTKDIYYKYLKDNFTKFNLMILLVYIQTGLNTSDDMDMLRFVTSNIRHHKEHGHKIYTLVVVNKEDDMQWNEGLIGIAINTYTTISVIELYKKFKKDILDDFFNEHDNYMEYNYNGFSDFFVKHIIEKAYIKLNKGGHFTDYMDVFNILISAGTFDKPTIEHIIETIIVNQYPILFSETKKDTKKVKIVKKVKFCNEIKKVKFCSEIDLPETIKVNDEISLSTFLIPSNPKKHAIEIIAWTPDLDLDILDLFYLRLC